MDVTGFLARLRIFIKAEWCRALAGCALGVTTALVGEILISDAPFKTFLAEEYAPFRKDWSGPNTYGIYLIALSIAAALSVAPASIRLARRWLRSYLSGVTAGMFFWPFFISVFVFGILHSSALRAAIFEVGLVAFIMVVGATLSYIASSRSEQRLQPIQIEIDSERLVKTGTRLSESDEPIQSWEEDALERGPIVGSMLFALLVSRTPVLGLFGEFGTGKSSILNLLSNELKRHAIVIRFSPWLPGSTETLASQLLGDIARECNREYFVPGLRKDARRLASALAKSVAMLNGISEFFSEATQYEEIERMQQALSRLPQPVVVLLDEVDRMQKDEILSLLKVIRGLRYSQNLGFVVASDRPTIERAVFDGQYGRETNTYFEKFFPASVRVPVMDAQTLQSFGIRRLVSSLKVRRWFTVDADELSFGEKLEEHWARLFTPFIDTLRSVGLLANDLGVAASPLRDEVNPLELTLVEMLRRFEPSVYESVWRYRDTLTGGVGMLSKGYVYRSDAEKEQLRKSLLEELNRNSSSTERRSAVFHILRLLFPLFREIEGKSSVVTRRSDDVSEEYKHISDPRLIAAYFRYKLPEDLFSVKALNAFIAAFARTANDNDAYGLFARTLDSMEKGSPIRTNFLERLADKVQARDFDIELASKIARIVMRGASKYLYDTFMVTFGEAGHALRIVIRVGLRTPLERRAKFLSECISLATDDTMAFRIQAILSKPGADFDLNVPFKDLYPSFVTRMRKLYGEGVDAYNTPLDTSDPQAFNLWGISDLSREGIEVDPRDREIQRDFWLGYIGNSRARLAKAFGGFFMPVAIYREDPSGYVENKIPVSDLRSFYRDLPDDGTLTDVDRKSLRRLKRLLDGDFKNGTGTPFDSDEDPNLEPGGEPVLE